MAALFYYTEISWSIS